MRRLAVIVTVVSTFGCANTQQLAGQVPAPQRAPICASLTEKEAISVSALLSELQLITISCHTNSSYNALIPRLRPALATKEKNLKAFFARAYGKRGQTEHDKYITELANLQSQQALKSGERFCSRNSNMFDQISPLWSIEDLATYTQSKTIQQALAVDECSDGTTPKHPRGRQLQNTSSR